MSAFDDTAEFEKAIAYADQFFAPLEQPFELRVGAATDMGKVRERNEDHYAVIRSKRSREILLSNLPEDLLRFAEDETYGLVVADGIGGSAGGSVASQLALQTMFDLAGRATSWVMKLTDLQAQQIYQRVEAYVTEVQKALRESSERNPALEGMGTTWTSMHVLGRHAVVVHVGDSRAYLYRTGKLWLITHDQTLGQEMVDAGVPEEEARRFRNILTDHLGTDKRAVAAQIYHLELQHGDRLLLCTDGLSDKVSAESIAETLGSVPEPQMACARLIERALAAGGSDNVTVVVCDVLPHWMKRQREGA
ncbi:MAG: PP2C family protein-serine/threonine phosphatase [Planctomycetota bacterium]